MIILLILGTPFSYIIFDFLEDILHLVPQVFNLDKLFSQKHSNKDTSWKITQQQPQNNFMITRKLIKLKFITLQIYSKAITST